MEPLNSCRARTRTSCPGHHHHHCHHNHCHYHHHYQIFFPHNHQLTTLPHHHHQHHHHHHYNFHRRVIAGIAPHISHPIPKPPLKYDTNVEGEDVVFRNGPGNGAEILHEQQYEGLDMAEEDDEEPIFVLTDEWKDFFAKSEAKRKLDKKHAGKKI